MCVLIETFLCFNQYIRKLKIKKVCLYILFFNEKNILKSETFEIVILRTLNYFFTKLFHFRSFFCTYVNFWQVLGKVWTILLVDASNRS